VQLPRAAGPANVPMDMPVELSVVQALMERAFAQVLLKLAFVQGQVSNCIKEMLQSAVMQVQ